MATETKTFYPQAYTESTFTSVTNPTNPVGQGASNTTYALLDTSKSHGATHTIYWPFDLSAIPGDAEIESVTCTAKIGNSTSSHISSLQGQLCSGTLAKGTSTEFRYEGANGTAKTISAGAWTREELSAIRLKIYAVRQYNISGGGAYVYFYGADLTVTYTYQSEKFMLKLGGAWHDIARVFKKVSGIWVEQEELANVVDQTKRLVNGGFYEMVLPEGYTRLKYIESTGQQYIDWGFKPTSNTRVVMDITVTSGATSFLFGSRHNSSANAESRSFSMPQISGASLRADYGSAETGIAVNPVQKLHIDVNKNVATVNGTEVKASAQTFQSSYNLFLLATNTAGTATAQTSARLGVCRAYENGTAIRSSYPCINPQGVVGLYDTINDVFYPSATGTPFNAPGSSVEPSEPSFTIAGTTYYFEEGMTFEEWCASSYNTGGFYTQGYFVYNVAGSRVKLNSAIYSSPAETIISGFAYILG